MSSDIDMRILKQITESHFVPLVFSAFGESGTIALRQILSFLPSYFHQRNPEHIEGHVYVASGVPEEEILESVNGSCDDVSRIVDLPPAGPGTILILLLATGRFRVWTSATIDIEIASRHGVLYHICPEREEVIVVNERHPILNPAPASCTVFCVPTFRSLSEALEDYRRERVRSSTCYLFRNAWEDSSRRLFFTEKPEHHMRRSLHQFLEVRLRDVDVLPEQNVDESHPVDIKVRWHFSKSEALIEIKWLGKSRKRSSITSYTDSRARDGAQQLVDYLDAYRQTNPDSDAKGYLVVIDGRRYRLTDNAVDVNERNGMYYRDKEIVFNPVFERNRSDFAKPIRMFAEPVCTVEPNVP